MAQMGGKPVLGALYVILFLFIPLNKVFVMFFLLIFTGFIDHLSKILYRQERPLWMNDDIDVETLLKELLDIFCLMNFKKKMVMLMT